MNFTPYDSIDQANEKQKLWFFEYIKHGNAAKAARAAGYADPVQSGYECKRLLKKIIDDWVSTHCLSAKETLHRLSEQATANINDVMNDLETYGHLVVSVSQNPMGGSSIHLNSQQAALNTLTRIYGLTNGKFSQKHEHSEQRQRPVAIEVVTPNEKGD